MSSTSSGNLLQQDLFRFELKIQGSIETRANTADQLDGHDLPRRVQGTNSAPMRLKSTSEKGEQSEHGHRDDPTELAGRNGGSV